MEIYIHGCSSCGVMAHYVRRILRERPDAVIKNSRYDETARLEHAGYVQQLGITWDYSPVVVENGTVTKLAEWNTFN